MARLKIRIKKRQTLPGGRYLWQVDFKRSSRTIRRCRTNLPEVQPILDLLRSTATGQHRVLQETNWRKHVIVTTIYLTHKSDVALIKMCHADAIRTIYQLVLETPGDQAE